MKPFAHILYSSAARTLALRNAKTVILLYKENIYHINKSNILRHG
jgi:hypothetical protein